MRILITNDDGIESEGILELAKEFEKDNEIMIVAPDVQRSAAGHSITISRPIIVKEVKIDGIESKAFSIDGTPADCVKICVEKLCRDKFDLIISGINAGTNLGSDVIYSGTVSAAIEGAIYKIPAIAVSTDVKGEKRDYSIAAKFTRIIAVKALENNLHNDIVLNINVPNIPSRLIKGIMVSELGNRIYTNCYVEKLMDGNIVGYKIEGYPVDEDKEGTDIYNFNNGYVTVTPLHYDLTNFKILKDVDSWYRGYNNAGKP